MLQTIAPASAPIKETIHVPGSKMLSLRSLLLASLADGISEIDNLRIDEDSDTLINALRQLGIIIQVDHASQSCTIAGCNGKLPKNQATVWCGQSVTTALSLSVMCAATAGVYYFDSTPHLRKQSFAALLQILHRQGVQLIPSDQPHLPFTLLGLDNLEGGSIVIDEQILPDATTAMLLISPYAHSPLKLILNDPQQKNAVEATSALMAEFGVLVHHLPQNQFSIPVPQRFQATNYTIEPDPLLIGYLAGAAALTRGQITIPNIPLAPTSNILFPLLTNMGLQMSVTNHQLFLQGPNELLGIDASLNQFNESFITLCAIAPFASSATRLSRIGNISSSESELIPRLCKELMKLNIHTESGHDWIKIFPGKPKGATLDCHQDPRIAMAFALIGLGTSDIKIEHAECVERIWPNYFNLLDEITAHANCLASR